MNKIRAKLSLLIVFLSSPLLVLAAPIDEATIQSVLSETRNAYLEKCLKDFKNVDGKVCLCLTEKTLSLIDKNALGKCENDEKGATCIAGVISTAAVQATTQANLEECVKVSRQNQATTNPAAEPATPNSSSNQAKIKNATVTN